MHLISTLKLAKTPQKLCICNKQVNDNKQLPYLHHCAHVLSVGHDGCDNKQAKIDLVRFACNTGLGPKGIGCVINK